MRIPSNEEIRFIVSNLIFHRNEIGKYTTAMGSARLDVFNKALIAYGMEESLVMRFKDNIIDDTPVLNTYRKAFNEKVAAPINVAYIVLDGLRGKEDDIWIQPNFTHFRILRLLEDVLLSRGYSKQTFEMIKAMFYNKTLSDNYIIL